MVAFYHLVLLLLAYLTTPINAATYDLADSVTAERFFANSNINVAYDEDSNAITWTAQTPLAVGCGASVLIADETVDGYQWQHLFSDMMEASVPTIDHAITLNLNDITSIVDIETGSPMSDGSSKIAFRMYAFLPYGKGVLASRTYALQLSNSTVYAIDFNDGYTGTLPKLASPSFMNDAVFMGNPLAFASGPCYETIDLTAGDSNVIVISGGNENEGACVCKADAGGFKKTRQLLLERRLQDDANCNEHSSPLVNYTLNEGAIAMSVDLNNEEKVAASFYYGLDPTNETQYSYEAFYDTDGLNDNDATSTLHHGIVRADAVAVAPSATVPLNDLPIAEENVADGSLVVGGVWIDSQFGVHYSRETRIPLSEVVEFIVPSEQPSASNSTEASSSESVRESSLCPAESIRNVASSAQGAFILDVSSSYSERYIAFNAIDEDPSTEWSSAGDGNDAYITIQLPFAANIVYVDFHTRTMSTSAQINEYQVEAGNKIDSSNVVAASCQVTDATKAYECDLDLSDGNDPLSAGARNVTLVTFRVINSSGGNTGAIDLSVYGCSVVDEVLYASLNESETAADEESGKSTVTADETADETPDVQKVVDTSDGSTMKVSALFFLLCALV
ncbi:hypothetical protein ACHAWO_000049 [Cyclotella atomus]|uniref:F5/8 type C domain-containing protein n=1 Tax=Cyclotella atomus TaxID=382360 RepID=A0ABD3QMX0_9STRA